MKEEITLSLDLPIKRTQKFFIGKISNSKLPQFHFPQGK